jgi:hypothetical protein
MVIKRNTLAGLQAVKNTARCRCGTWLPHGALARYELEKAEGRQVKRWYDCHTCRKSSTEFKQENTP